MSCLLRGLNKASANLIHVRADIGSLVLGEGTLSLLVLELPKGPVFPYGGRGARRPLYLWWEVKGSPTLG